MAITIDEMQVDVQGPPASGKPSTAETEPKKAVDLCMAIELLGERELRLRAD